MKRNITISIYKDQYEYISKLATHNGITFSEAMRTILRGFILQHQHKKSKNK